MFILVQGYYPSNKPGVEPRRPCRPVNITPWLHLSTVTNRVTITWGNFGKVWRRVAYPHLCLDACAVADCGVFIVLFFAAILCGSVLGESVHVWRALQPAEALFS